MEKIALGDTGRYTSRLGFGGSSLMGVMGLRESLKTLESAYDAGVRHFDVAPMYGYGEAERCLGKFLSRHASEVTVTTKYGIHPARRARFAGVGRKIARPLVNYFPGLKKRLAGAAKLAMPPQERARFTATDAKASLESSLAALGTSHIDVWLLHEAEASDLESDELLKLLESEVARGTIGTFGVGSDAAKVPGLLAFAPSYCRTIQYEWSILDPVVPPGIAFRIHHRALRENFRILDTALEAHPVMCRRWSDEIDFDLQDSGKLAQLMLKASLVMNPASVILFSSKEPQHIHANVRVAQDRSLDAPARKLHHLIQTERSALLNTTESGIQ